MVQTITMWSSGVAEINTGKNFLLCDGIPFTQDLQSKLDQISLEISSAGASQIHSEKDLFRQFEHVNVGGEVIPQDFGSTISTADFDWIMQHVDSEIAAQEQAEVDPEVDITQTS